MKHKYFIYWEDLNSKVEGNIILDINFRRISLIELCDFIRDNNRGFKFNPIIKFMIKL